MQGPSINLGVVAGCLIWVPASIAVVTLIGWIIQAEIDPVAGFAGIVLSVAIGAIGIIAPDPHITPWLLIGSISMVVLFPIARSVRERRELALLDVEQMERAYEALEKNEKDIGARVRIAKILFHRKNVNHAIALVEDALKGMPKDLFDEEYRMVGRWKAMGPVHPTQLVCVECAARNKTGAAFCYRCKSPILLHFAKGHWVPPSILRKLLLGWVAAVLLIVGIPVAASVLPPTKSAPVVVLLLCVSAFIAWVAVKGIGRTNR